MQHEDSKRSALVERRKRQRENHLAWKALMFPARPPPPYVEPPLREPWAKPSGASAGVVAMIRNQPFAHCEEPVPSVSTTDVSHVPAAAMEPKEGLLRRLQQELEERKPLLDTKRTTAPNCTVAVMCLPPDAVDDDLKRFGERFGRVVRVRVVRHKDSGVSRRYGFIQFSYEREVSKALRDCTDPMHPRPRILGKIVVVEAERGRTDPTYVPARFEPLRGLTRDRAQVDQGRESKEGASTADEFLDHLDDFLAAFS